MKNLARRFLCGAALVAAIVPAASAEHAAGRPSLRQIPKRSGTTEIADHALPFGDGFGAGTWSLPASGAGQATAQMFDESGRLRYVLRVMLARSGEVPPAGQPDGG